VTNDTHSRAYCGPTAVASITGEPISRVCDVFRTVRCGSEWPTWEFLPDVRATNSYHIEQVLRIFGYESQWHTIEGNPTLHAWLERRTGEMRTHPGIVIVTNHALAFSGQTTCDTHSGGWVISAEYAHYRLSRVKGALLISRRVPPCTDVFEEQARQLARKPKPSNYRVAFKRLAKQMGATFERDEMHLRVTLPSGIFLAMRHRNWVTSYANLSSFAENPDLSDLWRVGITYWFPRCPLLTGLAA
jgi:hypothetical protein